MTMPVCGICVWVCVCVWNMHYATYLRCTRRMRTMWNSKIMERKCDTLRQPPARAKLRVRCKRGRGGLPSLIFVSCGKVRKPRSQTKMNSAVAADTRAPKLTEKRVRHARRTYARELPNGNKNDHSHCVETCVYYWFLWASHRAATRFP